MFSSTIGRATCATLLLASASHVAFAENPHTRPLGDSRVVASVPFPGYPEGIVVANKKIYVSGPANFGVPGNFVPSTIHVYDLESGAFLQDITIQGQPSGLHALSCITADNKGNLFVVDIQQGIVRVDAKTGEQTIYAAPFYPNFPSQFNPPAPLLPNDLAFDKKGYLYVTDTFQATIWRIPPGGGAPQIWFQNAAIDGAFGPNGIRVDEKSEKLYFAVTFDGGFAGHIYTLPLVDNPTIADLKLFHGYEPGAGPDGLAFGKSGKLYVALAGSHQISVLSPDGTEEARYIGPATAANNTTLPWANPANLAFNDKTGALLVTNHASQVPNPEPLFAIFDVYVNDKAGKLHDSK
ncbi:MAG TPA: SMP-30/gluconolactonase/LRE family protein [Bryobacteraceae bacterium]|nr:SMP-30/gluconolactonase/LRE family protein [Bryobacteraceae bacterium]